MEKNKFKVDFSDYPNELKWIKEVAKREYRSVEMQIIATIKEICDGKWEWTQ